MLGWVLAGEPMLAGEPVLAREPALAQVRELPVGGRLAVSGAHALPEPHRCRPQYAAQFTAAGQVAALTGSQHEVLMIAGQATGPWPAARTREPVVRVGPGGSLLRVGPGRTDPLCQFGELVAAALADGGERDRVPGQSQGDLVRPADRVPAVDSVHGQDGAIYAA